MLDGNRTTATKQRLRFRVGAMQKEVGACVCEAEQWLRGLRDVQGVKGRTGASTAVRPWRLPVHGRQANDERESRGRCDGRESKRELTGNALDTLDVNGEDGDDRATAMFRTTAAVVEAKRRGRAFP